MEALAHPATPPVSAEMLQAAMAAVAQHGAGNAGAHPVSANSAVQVSHVLSDALAGGSSGKPDIDSLLHALGSAGHGNPDPVHALAIAGPHDALTQFHYGAHVLPTIDMMALHAASAPHG
jgi:hypothetical protein